MKVFQLQLLKIDCLQSARGRIDISPQMRQAGKQILDTVQNEDVIICNI